MSQTNNVYGLREGDTIEELSNYNYEALGEVEFFAGEPEQTWDDYALELVPVHINSPTLEQPRDTDQRGIIRNGEFLGMVSDQYKLLPNEEMVHAADEVAEDLGAVPFEDFDGDWFVELEDHVFMDDEGRRAHALYAWDEPVDIDGSGDEVQLGFGVHNSIDGSMGLRVGLFTFRHACANMVFMGIDDSGMSFDQRDVLSHSSKRHTHGLEVENLRAWIEETIEYGPAVIEAYQQWQDRSLDVETADRLVQLAQSSRLSKRVDIPGWMQDAVEMIEEAEQHAEENEQLGTDQFENGLPQEVRANLIEAAMPKAETAWDTYNDLTRNIWHNEDTNDQSKMRKFRNVHRAMPVSDSIR